MFQAAAEALIDSTKHHKLQSVPWCDTICTCMAKTVLMVIPVPMVLVVLLVLLQAPSFVELR